jgi:hypothetical protein
MPVSTRTPNKGPILSGPLVEKGRVVIPPTLSGPSIEWYRVNTCIAAFGLSRPALFRLIALDKIRSVHIKQPGSQKGIRLINAASMREYISSFEGAE